MTWFGEGLAITSAARGGDASGLKRRVVRNRGGEPVRVVVFVSPRSGTGCTTLVAALAAGCADDAGTLEFQGGGALPAKLSATSSHLSVGDLFFEDGASLTRMFAQNDDVLALRLSSALPANTRLLIIDAPPGDGPWTRQVLAIADALFVVLGADATAEEIGVAARLLGARDAEPPAGGCVVNRYDGRAPGQRTCVEALRHLFGDRLVQVIWEQPALSAELSPKQPEWRHTQAAAAMRRLLRSAGLRPDGGEWL